MPPVTPTATSMTATMIQMARLSSTVSVMIPAVVPASVPVSSSVSDPVEAGTGAVVTFSAAEAVLSGSVSETEPVLSGSVSVTAAPVVYCAVCISTRTLSMRISATRVAQPMVDSVAET